MPLLPILSVGAIASGPKKRFFVVANQIGASRVYSRIPPYKGTAMVQTSTKPTDFNRALGDAKKQAGGVADAFTDAAQDMYEQARESAADVSGPVAIIVI